MAGAIGTGVKLDAGKARWDLVPWRALGRVVDVLTYGAAKYSAWNWLSVPDYRDRYFAAAQRHLIAWREGPTLDPESGLEHLAHAACCVLFLLALDLGEGRP